MGTCRVCVCVRVCIDEIIAMRMCLLVINSFMLNLVNLTSQMHPWLVKTMMIIVFNTYQKTVFLCFESTVRKFQCCDLSTIPVRHRGRFKFFLPEIKVAVDANVIHECEYISPI